MKRHRTFEFYAGEYLKQNGYQVEVTQGVADWGVDIFCEKEGKKYVAQVKMYGTSKTLISRKQVFELYGVMAYFDCQGAMMVYNGGIMPDAVAAAGKLGVELVPLDYLEMDGELEEDLFEDDEYSFQSIWDQYIRPLANTEIKDSRGFSALVGEVTDGYITRINSKGKAMRVKSDLFKWMIDRMHGYGFAESIDLRNMFRTVHSPFVTLVFANIPICEVTYNPRRVVFKKK
jgi:restriction system protein